MIYFDICESNLHLRIYAHPKMVHSREGSKKKEKKTQTIEKNYRVS